MNQKPILVLLLLVSLTSTAQDKIAQFTTLMDSLATRQDFSGCVLVAENGRPVFQKALGYADRDKKIPIQLSTRFELASVSKQFTALAIMQLKEKGKLRYEDSLRQYFPALPFPGVTIRHLLNQTSGIPEFLSWTQAQVDTAKINFNADIMTQLPKVYHSTLFKPGIAFSYSNTNYLLLAQLVEKVSGEKFADYLQKYVFRPAGMKNTQVYSRRSAPKPIPDYALSYTWDAGANKFLDPDSTIANYNSFYMDGVAGPYGICSNVADMLQWDQALYSERLVKQSTLQEAYTPFKLPNGQNAGLAEGLDYGFGWLLSYDSAKGRNIWHNGGYDGYNTVIARYTDKNKTIIILSNIDQLNNSMSLIPALDDILWYGTLTIPPATEQPHGVHLPVATLLPLAGTYTVSNNPSLKMRITVSGSRIYAQYTNQSAFPIFASATDDFFYTVVAARIRFGRDINGKPDKLTLYQNGREIVMDRDAE